MRVIWENGDEFFYDFSSLTLKMLNMTWILIGEESIVEGKFEVSTRWMVLETLTKYQ